MKSVRGCASVSDVSIAQEQVGRGGPGETGKYRRDIGATETFSQHFDQYCAQIGGDLKILAQFEIVRSQTRPITNDLPAIDAASD